MNPEAMFPGIEMPAQDNEKSKSGKEIAWEQKRAEVDKIADRLGKGIDEKIKEAVAAFLVHDFSTSQSCEGHVDVEEGERFPWVEIYAPEPEGWEESEEKQKEWKAANLQQKKRMMDFFSEFYQERKTPFDARLSFDSIGAFGGFRVQSFGAETMELLSPEEQKQKLEIYRKEINDFSEFLKNKFLSK